ncbi:unnamed protein product [Soboliphyme baturini]|uniref:Secreted protein n=1 Tax=Soboliphyme baturini TaxID=241478 RepID=A0A183IUU2_9BILA|nr:unnamed protein product [Soboliphyme baturini]
MLFSVVSPSCVSLLVIETDFYLSSDKHQLVVSVSWVAHCDRVIALIAVIVVTRTLDGRTDGRRRRSRRFPPSKPPSRSIRRAITILERGVPAATFTAM